AWEIYNDRADEIDQELIKDWNDSLHTLLIFATLSSAILTAFVVESIRLLSEDPTETIKTALIVMSRQMANSSYPPFQPVPYTTPKYAVVVNSFLLLSLSCSVIAALLALQALEWVANYDPDPSELSPKRQALYRHRRSQGINKWKMGQIIASLPILIFVALILFFCGVSLWLWELNKVVSAMVMGGLCIVLLLYCATIFLSVVHADAPFRTSASDAAKALFRRVNAWSRKLVSFFLPNPFVYETRGVQKLIQWPRIQEIGQSTGELSISPPIHAKEERMKTEEEIKIELEAILWLINSVMLSTNSPATLLVLIRELMDIPADALMEAKHISKTPWDSIFRMLCRPYFGKRNENDYDESELKSAGFLLKAISMIGTGLRSPEFETFYSSLRQCEDESVAASAWLAYYKQLAPETTVSDLLIAVWIAFQSISRIHPNYFHFILLNLHEAWPRMDNYQREDALLLLADGCAIPIDHIHDHSDIPTITIHSLDIIFDLVALQPTVKHLMDGNPADNPAARYVVAMQHMHKDLNQVALSKLHRSIQQQLLAQIARTNLLSPQGRNKFLALLDLLIFIVDSETLALRNEEKGMFILILSMIYTSQGDKVPTDKIAKALFSGLCPAHEGEDQVLDRWTALICGFDDCLVHSPYAHGSYSAALDTVAWILDRQKPDFGSLDSASRDLLIQVRDPSLALLLTWHTPETWIFPAITHPDFGVWNSNIEKSVFKIWSSRSQGILHSHSRIAFFRALIIDGAPSAQGKAIAFLESSNFVTRDENEWLQVFSSPALERVFEHYTASEANMLEYTFTKITQYQWFYEEFGKANGLEWLPLISLNMASSRPAISEILVDQILFESANDDIRKPLIGTYVYLQSLGVNLAQSSPNKVLTPTSWTLNPPGPVYLREASLWLLFNSFSARISTSDPSYSPEKSQIPWFATIGRRKLEQDKSSSAGKMKSFDFVKSMTMEEWEEWMTTIRTLAMGSILGGLKPGHYHNRSKFGRDPDGLCSH
ncbi:hypothetical protein CPB86DRAFT_310221, partial [Serendipita vermifera]